MLNSSTFDLVIGMVFIRTSAGGRMKPDCLHRDDGLLSGSPAVST